MRNTLFIAAATFALPACGGDSGGTAIIVFQKHLGGEKASMKPGIVTLTERQSLRLFAGARAVSTVVACGVRRPLR
jgi:hypothetical protein